MNRKLALLFIVCVLPAYSDANNTGLKASVNIGISSVSHDSIANIEQRFDEILALRTWLLTRSRLRFNELNTVDPVMRRTRLGRVFIKKAETDQKALHQSEVYLLPIDIGTNSIKVNVENLLEGPTGATQWNNKAYNIEETINSLSSTKIIDSEEHSNQSIYTNNHNRYTSNWLWSKGFTSASSVGWRDFEKLESYEDSTSTDKSQQFGLSGHPYDIAGALIQLKDIRQMTGAYSENNKPYPYTSNIDEVYNVFPALTYPLIHFNYPNTKEPKAMLPYNQIELRPDATYKIKPEEARSHLYLTTKVITDARTDENKPEEAINWPYADYPAILINEQQFNTMKSIADDFKKSTESKSIDLINHSHYKLLDATLNATYHFDKVGFTVNLSGHYPLGFSSRDSTKLVKFTPGLTFDFSAGVSVPFDRGTVSTTVGATFQRGTLTVNRYNDESGRTLKYIDYSKTYSTSQKKQNTFKDFSEMLYILEFTLETAANKNEISYFGRYRKAFRNTVNPSIDLISHQQDVVSVGASFILL